MQTSFVDKGSTRGNCRMLTLPVTAGAAMALRRVNVLLDAMFCVVVLRLTSNDSFQAPETPGASRDVISRLPKWKKIMKG